MPERCLKHFDLYFKRLELYAKAMNITVQHKEIDSEGVYIPAHRKIFLDKDLSESAEIACLLHELGHHMDIALLGNKAFKKIDKAYERYEKVKKMGQHRDIVISCEKRAWSYGRAIAKELKIKLGKWYTQAEKYCLKSYS